jgi:hypothetical protein
MNWQSLTSQADLDVLISLFGGFHDGCLKEAHLWTGNCVFPDLSMSCAGNLDIRVRLLFQRQFNNPSAIELLFEQVTAFHLHPCPPNDDAIIMDATLSHYDGLFYWAETYDWSPKDAAREDITWIAGKTLSWRDASEWMGDELRFGPKNES